jgi:hypothetical protein
LFAFATCEEGQIHIKDGKKQTQKFIKTFNPGANPTYDRELQHHGCKTLQRHE